ncbi:MAG TPA: UDP-2,3-diacylglucosamine diphosphatase [Syntrophales bacterium]|nr:UDP-2,3-diacylglucosamine diphosphatase [Syntrophales bacterium]
MKAIFLSDAHLKNQSDDSYHSIVRFLDFVGGRVDDLFILGDLFDFWFCRDSHIYPEFKTVIERLVDLKRQGLRIFLFEGNHDFFLGDYFTKTHGISVFTEWADIDLNNKHVLLSHGDTVDRTNKKYLFLRKLLRSRLFYKLQGVIPPLILWEIARLSSTVSKELSTASADLLAVKMEAFSRGKFQEGYDAVILGHCHKPLLKEYVIEGRKRTFVSVGEWRKYLSYLYYDDGRFTLSFYEPVSSLKEARSDECFS